MHDIQHTGRPGQADGMAAVGLRSDPHLLLRVAWVVAYHCVPSTQAGPQKQGRQKQAQQSAMFRDVHKTHLQGMCHLQTLVPCRL